MHAEDKCDKSSLCKNITGDIWQNLLDDLTSYGQSSADATQNSHTVSKVNTTFYIVQPKVRRHSYRRSPALSDTGADKEQDSLHCPAYGSLLQQWDDGRVWVQGHKSIPSDLEKKIEDMTPSPTPDPSSQLMTKVVDVSSQVNNVLKKLTGFSPPPGGFSKVRDPYK